MDSLFPVFIFFALVAVTIAKGARMVPQGSKWVVQRLGKYHCTLNPGSTSSFRTSTASLTR